MTDQALNVRHYVFSNFPTQAPDCPRLQVSEAVFVRPARSRPLLTWFGYPCLPCVRFPVAAGVGCRLACELRWLFLLLVLHILILCFLLRLLTHVP